ncbi:aldose 1-epimerase [Noviherbaspirillum sp. CPCC 100848]|uniref:Aldose 1-epimerase n=1 Tax=Noviherbaspirillum album TaxID=3080276 RepID=A0ABU6JK33_9BURK|nr:aldose 1-epimerase [Noviherbaspirillum sp. CPCC 100848]MEC4723813.1 aldose 1-epimerase [Noviherbaspirillum sp. CPCC 100848]
MDRDSGKLVKLRNRHLEAWVSPSHGAAVARLFELETGFHILRETSQDEIARGETMKFGCFPMIPYSNRVGFRRLAFGGRSFELDCNRAGAPHSFHGNAWMQAWHIDELQDHHLAVSLVHAGDGHWPFPYTVRQELTLVQNALHLRLSLRNTGTAPFPAGGGWHPFFNIDPDSRVSFEAQRVWLNDEHMLPRESALTQGGWNFSDSRPTQALAVDNCFQGWSGNAVLEHPARRRRITIGGCERLASLVVFRPSDGREFIALEPVSHVNNGMNLMAQGHTDTGVLVLQPRDSMEIAMEIGVHGG